MMCYNVSDEICFERIYKRTMKKINVVTIIALLLALLVTLCACETGDGNSFDTTGGDDTTTSDQNISIIPNDTTTVNQSENVTPDDGTTTAVDTEGTTPDEDNGTTTTTTATEQPSLTNDPNSNFGELHPPTPKN